MTVNITPYYVNDSVIVQQVSMRSYKTGEYNFHLDGNINLTLHRLVMTGVKKFTWILPKNHSKIGIEYLYKILSNLGIKCKFIFIDYGKNAYENRKVVPKSFNALDKFSFNIYNKYIISDFCGIEANLYTFNISKVPGLDRWYIDEFIEYQQKAADKAPVIVLNENQKELLSGNIIVQDKIMSNKLLDMQFALNCNWQYKRALIKTLKQYNTNFISAVFFPFRISDPAYRFNDVLEYCKKYDKYLITTDVNDSAPDDKCIINLSHLEDKKKTYFSLIALYLTQEFPLDLEVICYDNIFEVMHQAPIELAYFLKNKFYLINNGDIIPHIKIIKLILMDKEKQNAKGYYL